MWTGHRQCHAVAAIQTSGALRRRSAVIDPAKRHLLNQARHCGRPCYTHSPGAMAYFLHPPSESERTRGFRRVNGMRRCQLEMQCLSWSLSSLISRPWWQRVARAKHAVSTKVQWFRGCRIGQAYDSLAKTFHRRFKSPGGCSRGCVRGDKAR